MVGSSEFRHYFDIFWRLWSTVQQVNYHLSCTNDIRVDMSSDSVDIADMKQNVNEIAINPQG